MVFNTISIIGLGYIGLPTASLLASRKQNIVGVDASEHVVNMVNAGKIHIVEPGLDVLLEQAVTDGYLRATTIPEAADAFLIAVPTPFTAEHKPDLSYVESVAHSIAPVLVQGNLIILESTSQVGTTEQFARWLAADRPDLTFPQNAGDAADIHIAYCPERVLPGRMLQELVSNDRVVGGMSSTASNMAANLYKIFVKGDIAMTNARTAEMCKLTENSFRDVNIAFANELSMICDKLNIDVWELISLANRHPRVNILQPGTGVGGHCIAVDPWFIVDSAPDEARLIRTAREVNDHKPQWVLEKIKVAIADVLAKEPRKTMQDVTVACLGLAFKPDIDDLRESPALRIAQAVAQLGCRVLVVEPHIEDLPVALQHPNVVLISFEDALKVTDAVCVLVRHTFFIKSKELAEFNNTILDVAGLLENRS